jgi:hypothetical protein
MCTTAEQPVTNTCNHVGLQSKEPLARSSMGNMRHADPVWNVVWRPADLQVRGGVIPSVFMFTHGVLYACVAAKSGRPAELTLLQSD